MRLHFDLTKYMMSILCVSGAVLKNTNVENIVFNYAKIISFYVSSV